MKFGAIRVVVRGAVVFGVVLVKNKTPDCESDVLWMLLVMYVFLYIMYLMNL